MEQRDDWHLTDEVHHALGRSDPFAAAVRATRMPMVITNPEQGDNPIVFANEAFQKLTGYTRSEIVGRNCRFLQGPETCREDVARVRRAIAEGESIEIDLLNYRKDGTTFWNALYMSPVKDEAGRIRFFFASQLDVSERVEAQTLLGTQRAAIEREVRQRTAELQAALEAKTLLLHEVDHRVKNNLMMLGSLVRMQARNIADPELRGALETMLGRIDAMATIHRRLYQLDDINRFDLGSFANELIADVVGATGRSDIAVDAKIEPIMISSHKAAPLGLVLSEIVTNAVKHGYRDGRAGTIKLAAHRVDGVATIEIADDGPGMDIHKPRSRSLGLSLINRLARQAGAQAVWSDAKPGTRVRLDVSMKD